MKYIVVERYADNGEFSHYDLINTENGETAIDDIDQALQLQQTGVMPCFSYGQIITDGTYDAKVIENTTIVHSTMVKYLHNDIFDNISGIGWKIK